MRLVSRFESNLLRFVHAMVERIPREQVLPLLKKRLPQPRCLRRDAVELLREALAKGTVLLLARDGWRRARHLRDGQVSDGRLWQRTAPPELGFVFSPAALEFLIGLAASDSVKKPGPALAQVTTGDLLICFLAYRLLRDTEAGPLLRSRTSVARNGLCRLMFPEDFADTPLVGVEWGPWTAGVGSCILECLQRPLAARWIDTESTKERVKDAVWMRTLGQRQAEMLGSFCGTMSAAGRWDLARFLLATAQMLLADNPTARRWIACEYDSKADQGHIQAESSHLALTK